MKKWYRFCFVAVALLMLVLVVPTGCAPKAAEVHKYLFGSTSASSSFFVLSVNECRIMNKAVPEAYITVTESGATYDNMQRIARGDMEGAFINDYDGIIALYRGLGIFEGKAFDKIRLLLFTTIGASTTCVRADSGVTKMEDLNGEVFCAGIPGSSDANKAETFFRVNNIKPEWFVGSFTDAVAATKDRRAVGFFKGMAGLSGLDASMIELQASTPILLIGFTDEQMKRGLAELPGVAWVKIPAGSVAGLPDNPAFQTAGYVDGPAVTADIPQEIQYKWVKAIVDNWAEISEFPACKGVDPIATTIEQAGLPEEHALLAAGTVQYFKEMGYDVPAKLIPPEYQE